MGHLYSVAPQLPTTASLLYKLHIYVNVFSDIFIFVELYLLQRLPIIMLYTKIIVNTCINDAIS